MRAYQEAQTGFEPVSTGVADHCLTTWLLRRITLSIYSDNVIIITEYNNCLTTDFIMKMQKTELKTYKTPVCSSMEMSLEGMLCTSFDNEEFEGSENYGNADDSNKGWY